MYNICFVCKSKILIQNLKKHFFTVHNFIFIRGDCSNEFQCGIDNCESILSSFKSYYIHTSNHNFPINANQHEPEQLCDLNFENVDNFDLQAVEDENISHNIEKEIKSRICKIRSETSVSEIDFKKFIEHYSSLNTIILKHFNISEPEISKINSFLMKNRAFNSQKLTLSKEIFHVEPQTIILAQKSEMRIRNGKSVLKIIKESFVYIPIIKTLIAIVQNKTLLNLIESEIISPCEGKNDTFKSFTDTNTFKTNDFFKQFPHAIRLDLYYDDIEVSNPIGSKKGLNKLAIFYFSIQNFPSHFNKDIKNIFLLQVCYSWDIKKFGFKKILEKLVSDLKTLENGIEISLSDKVYDLRAVLVRFVGDTLAAHEILGFLSPSCTCFCRSCLITREQLQLNFISICNTIVKRSEQSHSDQLSQIAENASLSKKYGVKENSILNDLKIFHVTKCAPFDAMHDILEGTAGFSLKLVLRFFINSKFFTIEFLNERIAKFRYGPMEFKNKPSPTFDQSHFTSKRNSVAQNAVQTWLLLRALPFLIGHCIPDEAANYMSLIVQMIKITEIVFATEINSHMIMELDSCIDNYEYLVRLLFPDVKFINKHHHLRHYVEMIQTHGPPHNYNCLSYESKHANIKQSVRISMNFINLPYSIAKKQTFMQSRNIAQQDYKKFDVEIVSSKVVKLITCVSSNYIREIVPDQNDIEKISSIKINKVAIKPNYIIVDITNEIFPSFYRVDEIIKIAARIFFFSCKYDTKIFDESLNAYEVELTENFSLINIETIALHKPLSIWHTFNDPQKEYISRKEYY